MPAAAAAAPGLNSTTKTRTHTLTRGQRTHFRNLFRRGRIFLLLDNLTFFLPIESRNRSSVLKRLLLHFCPPGTTTTTLSLEPSSFCSEFQTKTNPNLLQLSSPEEKKTNEGTAFASQISAGTDDAGRNARGNDDGIDAGCRRGRRRTTRNFLDADSPGFWKRDWAITAGRQLGENTFLTGKF